MANAAETCWALTKTTLAPVQLGGVCADKPGYHNTRDRVLSRWGSDYSTRLAIDLLGPGNVCAGLDLTPGTKAQMILYSTRLRDACLDPIDDRTKYIREWIGTLNGTNVACYIHDTESSGFRFDGTRDSTHLWHIHISWFRKWAADPLAGEAIASVLNGESYASWVARKSGTPAPIPQGGDDMGYVLVKSTADGKVYLSDFITRRLVPAGGTAEGTTWIAHLKWWIPNNGKSTVFDAGAFDESLLTPMFGPVVGTVSVPAPTVDIAALSAALLEKLGPLVGDDVTEAEIVAAVKKALREGSE